MPLASFDPAILYIGLDVQAPFPSLRLGYVSAPEKFIERAAEEILLIDRQGDQVTEEAVAELVEAGEVRRHANRALKVYAGRREKLAVTLRTSTLAMSSIFACPMEGWRSWLTFATQTHLDRLESNASAFGLSFLLKSKFFRKGTMAGEESGWVSLDWTIRGIRESGSANESGD